MSSFRIGDTAEIYGMIGAHSHYNHSLCTIIGPSIHRHVIDMCGRRGFAQVYLVDQDGFVCGIPAKYLRRPDEPCTELQELIAKWKLPDLIEA